MSQALFLFEKTGQVFLLVAHKLDLYFNPLWIKGSPNFRECNLITRLFHS